MIVNAIRECVFLVAISLVPAFVWGVMSPKKPIWDPEVLQEGEIRLADVLASGEDVLWLDARGNKDFLAGHIPGAMQLNEDNWDELFMEFLQSGRWTPGKRIVVYCGSSGCHASHSVAEKLRKNAGIPNVWVLKHGWEAWKRHQDGK